MKKAKKILAVVLALSLMLPIFSMTAAATSIGSIDTSDEPLITFMEYKECVSNEKYNTLLKHWAYDKEYPNDEYAAFPSFFGGAYLDEEKNLVIQLTSQDDSIIAYFKELIDLENVVFEEVDFPYTRLVAEKDAAVSKLVEANATNLDAITGIGISIPKNSVNLYICKSDLEKNSIDIQSVVNSLTDFSNINIIETHGKDQPCAIPYPGDQMRVGTSTDLDRSIGFWARNSNGDLGIITAPHKNLLENTRIYIDGVWFGNAGQPYCNGSVDAVFIPRGAAHFEPTRYVPGFNFSHVSGSCSSIPVGGTSYSRGYVSDIQPGTVRDISYTAVMTSANPANSYTLNNCVVTSASCQNHDSGGIVVGREHPTTPHVVGIIAGKQGGTDYVIYTKASYLLGTLNCTVY